MPTNRATIARSEPFPSRDAAASWLVEIRGDVERRDAAVETALQLLNRTLHAHRVASGDPHARDVGIGQSLVTRIGFGVGDEIVEGRYGEALELPRSAARVKRSMEAPEERFAALLGARETVLACEELVLRARMDVEARRFREAALQARVALEALLAEMKEIPGGRREGLETDRGPIGDAANAALRGPLTPELEQAVGESVERMDAALRARRLDSAG